MGKSAGRVEVFGTGLECLSDESLRDVNRQWTLARSLSDVVHALNNTLQVVSGNAELLEARLAADDGAVERVRAMRAQADRAAITMSQLLAYARESGGARAPVDVNQMVGEALAMRAHSLTKHRVGTTLEGETGRAVAALVRHVGLQLLLNACALAESWVVGKSGAAIRFTTVVAPAHVQLTIRGVSAEPGSAETDAAQPVVGDTHWRAMVALAATLGADAKLIEGPGLQLTFPVA